MTSNGSSSTAGSAADGVAPIKCALKFKPPTLVLFYKDLQSGKTRRRSMPLRGLRSESSVSVYASKLLQNPKHQPFLGRLPRSQLDSLLQRVKDAQRQFPSRDRSHQTTLLGEMPPLKFPTAPQRDNLLGKQFESAVAELLQLDGDNLEGGATAESSGGGKDREPARESSRDQTPRHLQQATPTGQEAPPNKGLSDGASGALSETRTKPLPGFGLKGEGEGGVAPLAAWLTDISRTEGARTDSRPPRSLPPLSSSQHRGSTNSKPVGRAHQRSYPGHKGEGWPNLTPETSLKNGTSVDPPLGERPVQPRPQTVPEEQAEETASATPPLPTSSGQEPPAQATPPLPTSSGRELPAQGPTATFATEVPDYSADFSSEKDHAGPLPAVPEDRSLSFEISEKLSLSDDDLSLSGDQPLDFGEAGHLSPGGIVTGESSDEAVEQPRPLISDEGEDLNQVSAELLAQKKAEMERLFEAHQLRPGDPGYIYDREVDFGLGKIESGWDESSSSQEF